MNSSRHGIARSSEIECRDVADAILSVGGIDNVNEQNSISLKGMTVSYAQSCILNIYVTCNIAII